MKDLFHSAVITIIVMTVVNPLTHAQLHSPNTVFSAGKKNIAEDKAAQAPSGDSLLQLKNNYPLAYNHLLHEFKNATSLFYVVKKDLLLISFTNDGHKTFTVYSVNGEFRHSIADLGLALPGIITEQLKKEYPAYSVYYGKEIRANNNNLYQVVIENNYEYRLINFLDAEMEEVKRLKK